MRIRQETGDDPFANPAETTSQASRKIYSPIQTRPRLAYSVSSTPLLLPGALHTMYIEKKRMPHVHLLYWPH